MLFTRRFTKYVKAIKYSHYIAMLATALLIFVCMPGIQSYDELKSANTSVIAFVNGTRIGCVKDADTASRLVREARRRIARENEGLVLMDCDLVLTACPDVVVQFDLDEDVIANAAVILTDSSMKTKQPAYEVKINEFTVNLKTIEEVLALLDAAKEVYDAAGEWKVSLVTDTSRELDVLTAKMEREEDSAKKLDEPVIFPLGGALLRMDEIYHSTFNNTIDQNRFGIRNLDFAEEVEVVQAYVDADTISTLEEAIESVTKKQEKNQVYEVVAGDSLGLIAQKNDMTIADIIAMNPVNIPNESAMIRPGDEIIVSSPQPELSVIRTERAYYEESYDAEVQYIDNDEWYTNHTEVRREPVTGYRKVIADMTYRNAELKSTQIIYENVVVEAVAKVIERGTQAPPTFLKPISGGRLSSNFGKRKAPTKGASTFHKGVDWAVPIGTAVVASSDGTVIRAGWGSGYGYCVYIQHGDGKVTRYGHLSKILVKNGQSVKQGEKIALSGNTGVSSGPHIHFEILVNGSQVNPLNYLN